MATKRDYYDILGLSRDATTEDVRRAYRQHALKYHPDRNKSQDAADKFKEINEAYQILTDPERRRAYDQFGHAGVEAGASAGQGFSGFEGFGGFGDIFDAFFGGGTRRGPRPGRDIEVETGISFEEAAFGAEQRVTLERVETCSRCDGNRAEPGTDVERCSTCGGSGEVRRVQRNIFGQFTQVTSCTSCSGTGRTVRTPCSECRGRGRAPRKRNISVTIPAGIDDATRILLRGEGEAGEPGAPPGDLYVLVRVRPHEVFKRDGNNLLVEYEVNMAQAALGDTVDVPTLGGTRELKIPAGTQSGSVFRLRGEGIADVSSGRRGDELVRVNVVIPTKLTDQQRRLLKELKGTLAEGAGPSADGHHSGNGWFDKIKDVIS